MKITEPDYDYWLSLGEWDSKQAACIFNRVDPTEDGWRVKFPHEIEENHRQNEKEWQREVYRTYTIIETADKSSWRKYVNMDSDPFFYRERPKKASPHIFISFALDKKIDMPDALLEWQRETKENINPDKSNLSTNNITPGQDRPIEKTFDEWRQIVNDFENSENYKRYGKDIQQKLIEDWLVEKVDTRDKSRLLKKLITAHYEIITGRK